MCLIIVDNRTWTRTSRIWRFGHANDYFVLWATRDRALQWQRHWFECHIQVDQVCHAIRLIKKKIVALICFKEPEPLETLFPTTTYIEPVPTEMVKKPDLGKFYFFAETVVTTQSLTRTDYLDHLTVNGTRRQILAQSDSITHLMCHFFCHVWSCSSIFFK